MYIVYVDNKSLLSLFRIHGEEIRSALTNRLIQRLMANNINLENNGKQFRKFTLSRYIVLLVSQKMYVLVKWDNNKII